MCIIVYKPEGVNFPTKKVFKECFNNNPHGAGFAYIENGQVKIQKGYMGFTSFNKALRQVRMRIGDKSPYVLHFRISTQAGERPDCCHPFPLSSKMDDLRQLTFSSDYAVAHNGIIDLTSSYSKTVTYSDTMEFITNYLSLIIDKPTFYKDKKKVTLIDRLIDSKMAILDKSGHCTLIGTFVEEGGVFYSNTTYKSPKYSFQDSYPYRYTAYEYGAWRNYNEENLEPVSLYNCSLENYGDLSECNECIDRNTCPYWVDDEEDDAYATKSYSTTAVKGVPPMSR